MSSVFCSSPHFHVGCGAVDSWEHSGFQCSTVAVGINVSVGAGRWNYIKEFVNKYNFVSLFKNIAYDISLLVFYYICVMDFLPDVFILYLFLSWWITCCFVKYVAYYSEDVCQQSVHNCFQGVKAVDWLHIS